MTNPSDYHVVVAAGQEYSELKPVPVNKETPITITSKLGKIELLVRVKDFRATSDSSCPANCSYFKDPSRSSSRFSISWRLTPSKPINGATLMWVNDFDHSITHLLPPFFGAALDVAKRWVDPGMEAEPYSDTPYIRGPTLSSVNVLHVRDKEKPGKFGDGVLKEGADEGEAQKELKDKGVPLEEAARRKWFLEKKRREEWTFEEGRSYDNDFHNGYLDFNGLYSSLRLYSNYANLRGRFHIEIAHGHFL
jgi:hypothetical protein